MVLKWKVAQSYREQRQSHLALSFAHPSQAALVDDITMLAAARSAARTGVRAAAGSGVARALGGVPTATGASTRLRAGQLGAVAAKYGAVAGSPPCFGRGFAWIGVFGGGGGGGGGGGWGALTSTRALSSSSGDASGSSSAADKLAAKRSARGATPTPGAFGEGPRAAGGAARGSGGAKGGKGRAIPLNDRIFKQGNPESLLRLVAGAYTRSHFSST